MARRLAWQVCFAAGVAASLGAPWDALAAPAATARDVVRDVVISGTERVNQAAVRERLSVKAGHPYDPAEADRTLKALYATGEFSDVRIGRSGGKVIVTVVENPTIASINIAGNGEIAADKLEPMLTLRSGVPYTRAKGEADARRLRDHYRREGRSQTRVAVAAVPAGRGRVAVTFEVTESAVNKVARIAFAGANEISARELEGVVTTTPTGYFDFLATGLTYDPERLALDRELLRRHYQKSGFADVRIGEARADYDAAAGTYAITFPIEEGVRFAFGRLDVDVRMVGVDAGLLTEHLPSGGIYDGGAIDAAAARMTADLVRSGHSFARVRPVLHRDATMRTMGVTFQVDEGPRLHVARIEIKGNTRTTDAVVRRALRFGEGDPFSGYALEQAKKRVTATGFFKTVEIEAQPVRDTPDRVVVTVQVVEAETGDLSFGVGYSTAEGVIGDVSFSERNLLGRGQYLRLKLAGSLTRFDAEVSFTEPHFLGSDVAAGFDLFYRTADRSLQSSFKSQRAGATTRIGFPITDEITTGLSYTFARNTLYDVGPGASFAIKDAIPGYPDKTSTTYYTSAVGTTVTFDNRDSRKAPTRGIYLSVGEEVAGLGGDVRYAKTTADARGYIPLSHGMVMAGRVTGGVVSGWGGQDVRLLDMFYKGPDLVRGFAAAGIGPRDMASGNRDALGGLAYYGTSAEVRFPLPFVPQDIGLRAGVFADAGSLFGTSASASRLPALAGNSAAPRASVGAQLVWDSPVGALRLDYAVPLMKQAGDKTQPFSFGYGPSF